MKTDPLTGKQHRGFALLSPERRLEAQSKGRATIQATAAPRKWSTSKEELHTLHWEKGLSLAQIARSYKVSTQTVLNRMKKLGIPRRTSAQATALRRLDAEVAERASVVRRGSRNHLWRGGLTPFYLLLRSNARMKQWREQVFVRDDYTCQGCGKRGGALQADHKDSFATILSEEGITTVEAALVCARLWDVSNGRTLCLKCHRATPTYGRQLPHSKPV